MLNKTQKTVTSIGIILIVCSGLFVPYEGERLSEGDNPKVFLGYHFLLDPTIEGHAFEKMTGREVKPDFYPTIYFEYNTHIIFSIIWIELAIIILATLGLTIIFQKNNPIIPDE